MMITNAAMISDTNMIRPGTAILAGYPAFLFVTRSSGEFLTKAVSPSGFCGGG
jgi:hypothetical protein